MKGTPVNLRFKTSAVVGLVMVGIGTIVYAACFVLPPFQGEIEAEWAARKVVVLCAVGMTLLGGILVLVSRRANL